MMYITQVSFREKEKRRHKHTYIHAKRQTAMEDVCVSHWKIGSLIYYVDALLILVMDCTTLYIMYNNYNNGET